MRDDEYQEIVDTLAREDSTVYAYPGGWFCVWGGGDKRTFEKLPESKQREILEKLSGGQTMERNNYVEIPLSPLLLKGGTSESTLSELPRMSPAPDSNRWAPNFYGIAPPVRRMGPVKKGLLMLLALMAVTALLGLALWAAMTGGF